MNPNHDAILSADQDARAGLFTATAQRLGTTPQNGACFGCRGRGAKAARDGRHRWAGLGDTADAVRAPDALCALWEAGTADLGQGTCRGGTARRRSVRIVTDRDPLGQGGVDERLVLRLGVKALV